MKLTSLLLACLLVIVACSPNADTDVAQDEPQQAEVIEDNSAQSAEEENSEDADTMDEGESDDMAESDSDMDESDSDDMAESDSDMMESDSMDEEHSDDMAESDTDMMESDGMDEEHSDDMAESDSDMMESDEMDESDNMDESDSAMTESDTDDMAQTVAYNGPDWTSFELINAKTGETFTFADFAGKTVFIEPMATWCTNCLNQQRRIKDVVGELSPDEYVIFSLSVETTLLPEDLGEYANRHEFGWNFAVASDELLMALVQQFGRSVSSPPSVPHFTISADGTAGNFSTGSKTGEQFLALVRGAAAG